MDKKVSISLKGMPPMVLPPFNPKLHKMKKERDTIWYQKRTIIIGRITLILQLLILGFLIYKYFFT